jgi:hypothetical protein
MVEKLFCFSLKNGATVAIETKLVALKAFADLRPLRNEFAAVTENIRRAGPSLRRGAFFSVEQSAGRHNKRHGRGDSESIADRPHLSGFQLHE